MLRKLGIVVAVLTLGFAGAALAVAGTGSSTSVNAVEGQAFSGNVASYTSALVGNQRFVYQMFEDVLGRAPSSADLSSWTSVLNGGFVSRADVTGGILQSSEYRGLLVDSIYASYLQRSPSSIERSLGIITLGFTPDEEYRASILGGTEFYADQGGGTVDGFLGALYQHVLGRAPTSAELALYEGELAGGTTPQDVALAVLTSPEAREELVQSYFQRFLHRAATTTELGAYVGMLGSGTTDEHVIAAIIGSDEYFANTQVASAVIDWGDGSPADTVTFTIEATNTIAGSHTYAEEGTYPVGVTIDDIDGPATASGSATVADAALSATPVSITVAKRNEFTETVATFTDANPAATTADFTATIDWGDGSTSAGTVSADPAGGFAVTGTHAYKKKTNHSVVVSIADDGGASATATSTIRVTPH
jgi:hypothetical protein